MRVQKLKNIPCSRNDMSIVFALFNRGVCVRLSPRSLYILGEDKKTRPVDQQSVKNDETNR